MRITFYGIFEAVDGTRISLEICVNRNFKEKNLSMKLHLNIKNAF